MGPERRLGNRPPEDHRPHDLAVPAPDQVHVWLASLDPATEQSWCRRIAATTKDERDRASRFRRAEDGERYLAAHGALRLLLGHYLTCDPLALHFAVSTNGKPFLENQQLQFNLSHSGDFALIAVAWSRQVGVDIEQMRPMTDLQSVAARVCTPGELDRLAGLAELAARARILCDVDTQRSAGKGHR